MSDPFSKVMPGQRFQPSARAWNGFVDAARAHRERSKETGSDSLTYSDSARVIKVKNNSGADRDQFSVLGMNGAIFTHTDNSVLYKSQLALNGIVPTIADHFDRFVILKVPLKSGDVGRAYIGGAFTARINIGNANHRWATIDVADPSRMKSSGSGYVQILDKESGTGVKFCYVSMNLDRDRILAALTQTGGSAGTSSSECTFTYTAKTLDAGDTIATAVGLKGHRPVNAAMTAATYGEIGKDEAGNWKIFWCDERISQTTCT